MTPTLDLKALRELALKATPGPWTFRPSGWHHPTERAAIIAPYDGVNTRYVKMGEDQNAEYAAAFNPQTVSALLDELVALRAENERLGLEIELSHRALDSYTSGVGAGYKLSRRLTELVAALTPHSDRSEP